MFNMRNPTFRKLFPEWAEAHEKRQQEQATAAFASGEERKANDMSASLQRSEGANPGVLQQRASDRCEPDKASAQGLPGDALAGPAARSSTGTTDGAPQPRAPPLRTPGVVTCFVMVALAIAMVPLINATVLFFRSSA